MTYILIIPGKLNNLNDYTAACRTNPYEGAKMKSNNETRAVQAILSQFRRLRINCPVYIKYRWYEPNRRRDLDNISSFGRKVIQDALVKAKVLKNDGWKEITGFQDNFFVDKDNPRIEVEIQEVV